MKVDQLAPALGLGEFCRKQNSTKYTYIKTINIKILINQNITTEFLKSKLIKIRFVMLAKWANRQDLLSKVKEVFNLIGV